MKLDSALKLYIVLYVVSFLLTWLVSIPMLIHVTPQSECLLFVTPYIQYGSAFSKSAHLFPSFTIRHTCYVQFGYANSDRTGDQFLTKVLRSTIMGRIRATKCHSSLTIFNFLC